ncbi:hypothetical protein FGM00_12965 [Aggregatimonas sangjinii]|uniref:Polysaccharide lyase 14 domain-containing protein n=1 Tax=Aggregatimonas sangjinii TaxID=2583587 RepID=A0A5B7SVC2_9FLAO|nr:DUF5320 domain-containing protein [Aggregatimonas sangjinii]QCX00978.1 hypothetical protein FGM00_12965 [Aggregatimonas sangjinii]
MKSMTIKIRPGFLKLLFVSLIFIYSCDREAGVDDLEIQQEVLEQTKSTSSVSSGKGNETIVLKGGIESPNNAGNCYPKRTQPEVIMSGINETSYKMKFQIKFDRYFDFDRGGKLGYGMFTGDGPGGCRGDDAKNNKGGSFRVMWRGLGEGPNPNKCVVDNDKLITGEFFPYIYHKNMTDRCGEDFGKKYSIVRNKWYTIVMEFKSNTGSNANGVAKLSIGPSGSNNFTVVLDKRNMVWSTNPSKNFVNVIKHNFFRGGAGASWASHVDGRIYIRNVQLGI